MTVVVVVQRFRLIELTGKNDIDLLKEIVKFLKGLVCRKGKEGDEQG